jgi:hypothetical protein
VADLAQAAAWHRQIAALVNAADRAGLAAVDSAAADGLPALRARLWHQEALFTQLATRDGAALPALQPSAAQVDTAAAGLTGLTGSAVVQLLHSASSTLDAAEQVLQAYLAGAPVGSDVALAASSGSGSSVPGGQSASGLSIPASGALTPSSAQPTPAGAGQTAAGAPPDPARRSSRTSGWSVSLRNGLVYGVGALRRPQRDGAPARGTVLPAHPARVRLGGVLGRDRRGLLARARGDIGQAHSATRRGDLPDP